MQIMAFILFWVLATAGLVVVRGILFLAALVPALRSKSEALGEAVMRSWSGALYMQVISLFLFVPLLLLTWGIQLAAERLGATGAILGLITMPTGLLAIAIPPVATLLGAVHGFKAGWFEATGRDPEADLLRDRSAQWMRRAGLGWATPW